MLASGDCEGAGGMLDPTSVKSGKLLIKQLLHLKRKRVIFIIGEYHTCIQGNKLKDCKGSICHSLHAKICKNFLMVVTAMEKIAVLVASDSYYVCGTEQHVASFVI